MELERGHAERILPMMDELLAESAEAALTLDAIAFGRGRARSPGVRLAASVTQGLAFGAGSPWCRCPIFAAVAQRACDLAERRMLVCNDARMREVYWALLRARAGRTRDAATVDGARQQCPADRAAAGSVAPTRRARLPGRGFAALIRVCGAAGCPVDAASSRPLLPRASEIASAGQSPRSTRAGCWRPRRPFPSICAMMWPSQRHPELDVPGDFFAR